MDPAAIIKGHEYHKRALDAYERFRWAAEFHTMKDGWIDFLVDSNTVFSTLEAGSRQNPTSRQWMGAINKERTVDPLLNYLHQARNSKEHGLQELIVSSDAGTIVLGDESGGVKIAAASVMEGGQMLFSRNFPDPLTEQTTFVVTRPVLVRVTDDRFGTSFDPPTMHLDIAAGYDLSPVLAADLMLIYLAKMMVCAEYYSERAASMR
jgi:hypothetical protein